MSEGKVTTASIPRMVTLKIQHSVLVGELCGELATALGWDDERIVIAVLMGYAHDIGSVEEIADTGEWMHVHDHGLRGCRLLSARCEMFGDEYKEVLSAIRDHNKPDVTDPTNEFLKILRDTDKLATLFLINDLLDVGGLDAYCAGFFKGRVTLVGVCTQMLDWMNDINYDWVRERIRSIGLVDKLKGVVENGKGNEEDGHDSGSGAPIVASGDVDD